MNTRTSPSRTSALVRRAASTAAIAFALGASALGQTIFEETFEQGWNGWSTSNGVWQVGIPTSGPGAPYSGTRVAATELSGNYHGDFDARLQSPEIQLPAIGASEEIWLYFRSWYNYGACDSGWTQVRVFDQTSASWGAWETVGPTVVQYSPWSLQGVELTDFAGERIQIGFWHSAYTPNGCGQSLTGWYLDDLEVRRLAPQLDGTFEFAAGGDWDGWWTDRGVWGLGTPSTGPAGAFTGSGAAGTVLDGNYPGDADSRLVAPTVDLPTVGSNEELHLTFQQWFSYAACDSARVEISTFDAATGDWTAFAPLGVDVVNYSYSPWSLARVDLTAFAGSRARIAFLHTAYTPNGCGASSTGWYIDDVQIQPIAPLFTGDFDSGWAGWSADRGVWQVGAPTSGPGAAFAGPGAAGTVLGGNYPGDTDSRLISPTVDLPTVGSNEELHLTFQQWFSYAACDSARVEISTFDAATGDWTAFAPLGVDVVNYSYSPWSLARVDLTAFAGSRARIAFLHTAYTPNGCGASSTGWYIDDVQIQPIAPLFTGDFDSGWAGWSADRGVWQVGAPTSGPGAAFAGPGAAGTVLGGNYPGDTDSRLISPTVDLPSVAAGQELHLSFREWFDYRACDAGYVQVSTFDAAAQIWGDFVTVSDSVTFNTPWSLRVIDLSAFAGERVRIAFYHTGYTPNGCGASGAGWYVDEVALDVVMPRFIGDFENGWAGWGASHGVWQIGVPTSGPNGTVEGLALAGTVLDGNYPGDTDSRLISPTVTLPSANGGELAVRFQEWYSYGACDSGVVQVSEFDPMTGTWLPWASAGATVSGTFGWHLRSVDLTPYESKTIRIAFLHSGYTPNGCGQSGAGWYVDDVRLQGSVGDVYCTPAVINSTGAPARIRAFGSEIATVNRVDLFVSQMQPGASGYLLASMTQDYVPFAGGSPGTLCLGGYVVRYSALAQPASPSGEFGITIDTTSVPSGPVHVMTAGATWNFQAWFRDGSNSSNFTDAVSITFM